MLPPLTVPGHLVVPLTLMLALASVGRAVAAPSPTAPAGAGAARAPANRLELEAREAFAVGDYQKAVGLFGKLYAETLHPTYLRNIGRCYQNLGDPDRAITSFRDYLRKAQNLSPPERTEIEGYIAEMELLEARKAKASEGEKPAAAPARPAERTAHPAVTTAAPPLPAAVENKRRGSRWWLWTAIGVAALGAASVGAALVLARPKDATCPPGIDCFKP